MNEYKIMAQKMLETLNAFEKRLNAVCGQGWQPVSLSCMGHRSVVLLRRVEKEYTY